MADERQEEDYIEIKIPSQEPEPTAKKEEPAKKDEPKKKAAKKATKNAAKKPVVPAKKARKEPSGGMNWLWAILLVIGLVVIAAVIYLSLQQANAGNEETGDQQVAALVDNVPIYQEEIDKIHENLPATMGEIDKEVILDQLIEQELLVQEAEKQGIRITDEELQAYIDELLAYFGVPKDQFDAALEAQDMTRAEFERNSERQLIVNTLLNQTVYERINITDEDIEKYYADNQGMFVVPASSTVRHILITAKANETDDETKARAEAIMAEADEDSFCDLVANHTADVASITTCGEYDVYQNGQYVPEFEEAAFAMDVDGMAITETDYGYHIMWKTAEAEAGILPLEDVADQVEAVLFQEQASADIAAYIAELRDNAVIEKYPEMAKESGAAPIIVEEEPAEEPVVVVEETKPIREENFGACLADAGAVMYGVDWAPDVQEQMLEIGEAFNEVDYVDCDPASGDAPAACDDIAVYPTWVIGDLVLEGKQSVNALSRETGC